MKLIILYSLITTLLFSCVKKEIEITESFIYNPNGFSKGFTLVPIEVLNFDSTGIPEKYNEVHLKRADLIIWNQKHNIKYIWFKKSNDKYYWTKGFDGKYSTLPFNLENNQWYLLWSSEFASGVFETTNHLYFIKKDRNGFNVYERLQYHFLLNRDKFNIGLW